MVGTSLCASRADERQGPQTTNRSSRHAGRRVSMSKSHVEYLQDMYAAFDQRDLETVIQSLDPQIEWRVAENHPIAGGSPYHGRDGVQQVLQHLAREWTRWSPTIDEWLPAGDAVVVADTTECTGRPGLRWTPSSSISGGSTREDPSVSSSTPTRPSSPRPRDGLNTSSADREPEPLCSIPGEKDRQGRLRL